MTTTAARPAQLSLPGQAAAPDGPVDLAGMYLMHRGFRRDLDAFATATAATSVGDRSRWERLSRRFALFAGILHNHHHGEDVGLWPLLHERGADPTVLDALEAEHAQIDPLLGTCTEDLAALAGGTGNDSTRTRLSECTAKLRDALHAHLAHEERDGMALVQAHLTQEDWDRLDREVFAKDYRPRDVPAVLGWVVSGLTRDQMMRMPGAKAALVPFARLCAWRFDRAEARTFGAATSTTTGDRVLTVVQRRVARLHTALLRRSGGRFGNRFRGGDVVLLTHRGRKSGRTFTTPLLHVRDGDDLVVAASNGGVDAEPQWWLNLQADPRGEVEVRGRRWPVVGAAVEDADRDRLWQALMDRCPTYDDYQAKVSRRITLVRLSPAGE